MKQSHKVEINSAPAWTESWGSGTDQAMHSRPSFGNSGVTTPAVNIMETREDLRVEMVAPGMKKDDFKVTLQENVLTISYDHADNQGGERKEWKYRMREYNYHSFMRSFQLPDIVEEQGIDAGYSEGILTVRIPKKKEAISRRIEVT